MRYKLSEKGTQIHGDLNRVIGEEDPSFETVYRCGGSEALPIHG